MDIEALQNKVTAKSRACPLSGVSLIQGLNPMFPRVVHRSFQTACSRMQARGRSVCSDEVMECNGVIRENHNSSVAIHNRSAGTIDDTWCDASVMGSTDTTTKLLNDNHEIDDHEYGTNLKILPCNNQVKELQTILRDKNTTRSDFKFYADRLIRLVIEESLNQLPFTKCVVTTPTGAKYKGLKYQKGNCGVSIVRSGEAMEQGLRDCCRSIRIGKILVESDADTHEARVVYAKFPDDISERKVLLMYPIMSTGNTVIKAIAVLKEHNVLEENIILSNLFCTPIAAKSLVTAFPKMKILTSEIHTVAPNHFGQKYFGCTRVVVETPNVQEKDS